MSSLAVKRLLAICLLVTCCGALHTRVSAARDPRLAALQSFRHGTLAEFLRDPARYHSYQAARLACVTYASDLPIPFKGSRDGKEYYWLTPKKGRYAGLGVILEVQGQYEFGTSAMLGRVRADSPFRTALRTGKGAEKFHILRIAILDTTQEA